MTQTTNAREPIRANWRVSDVLARDPRLLDVLIDQSPAFGHLRNPLLRRVRTRLITVAQAARIAGLDSEVLVARLNSAIGVATPDASPTSRGDTVETSAPPAWVGEAKVAAQLDARPFQERGEEPFGAIAAAAATVPPGQVLRLRNSFEPVPLYDVLGRRGFVAWANQLGPADWEVLFLNTGAPRATDQAAEADVSPTADHDWSEASPVVVDVRDLVPPEPMIRILEALEALPAGGALLVHHVRRPMHLYPRLDELGYRHSTREVSPGQIEVLIQKPRGPGEAPA